MKKFLLGFALVFSLFALQMCKPKQQGLKEDIATISKSANGIVGVAIMNIENGDTLTYNGALHLPMQSVFKFPIAMAILNKVDSGTLTLDKKIHFGKEDMIKGTWSPLAQICPNGDTDVTISTLLSFMVSQSDNIACDALIKTLGGPGAVNNYMHSLGANGIEIVANEATMHSAWNVQYTNWCEPRQIMYLLNNFYNGKYLSKSSTAFLYKIMTETTTSPKRIKGLLPAGTVVAHKSGSSGTNKDSIAAATNDVGIITLPNGKHIIIAAFVSDSKAKDSIRDLVIAQITKTVFDNACNNKPLQ